MLTDWSQLLKNKLEETDVELIKLSRKKNDTEIVLDIDLDKIKVKRCDRCTIICKCGEKHIIAVRQGAEKGLLCYTCKRNIYYKKIGYMIWNNETLWKFYNEKTKEYPVQSKNYTWWNKNHNNFVSALQDYRAKHHQEELPFISLKQSRKKGGIYLWGEALEIYKIQGTIGLTKSNLNKKESFYTYIANKKIIKKTGKKGNKNYPCIEVCEKLKEYFPDECKNILNERIKYLKKTFPIECDSFEEMCEIHIRPILPDIFKQDNLNGTLLTQHSFEENNHCNIINAWVRKFKKNIYDVRKYFDFELCDKNKCISYQKIICDSQCEMRVYNFLFLRGVDIHEKQKYSGELARYIDDGRFFSEKINKWVIIEIFGDKRGNYEERKQKKINYWEKNENEHEVLLSLSYEDTTKKYKLIELFKPYIGNPSEKELSTEFLEEMKKHNYKNINIAKKNEIFKEAMEIKKNSEDCMLPPLSELPKHIKNFIYSSSFDGGVDKFREQLGEDKDIARKINKEKGIIKKRKIVSNRTEEEKKAIKTKQKKKYANRTEEEKKAINKKISKSRLKNGSAKGKNNPMYGKKGKDNPNFGKKYGPKFDYKKKFIPILVDFIKSLDSMCSDDYIFFTESLWVKHTKTLKDCSKKPYNNPGEYNPWEKTGFDGFFKDAKKYMKENNIISSFDIIQIVEFL